jgi:heme/copper-type cytochrome/quinol oxidase subunit 2
MISPILADAIFWIAVAACLVAQVAILRSVVVTRSGSAARRATEIAWAVAPAVALALVLAATWRTLHPGAEVRPAAVTAEVTT